MSETTLPVQYILYTNNAVSVSFSDGSQIKLSPCGTTFIHRQTPCSSQHPLQSDVMIQQRTRFVTSTFRQKVQQALDFRNRFVERPFLCQDLLEQCSILRYHLDIFVVQWPSFVSNASFAVYPDGSAQIYSVNDHASVCLSCHQRSFTVRYLAKLSNDYRASAKSDSRASEDHNNLNSSGLPKSNLVEVKNRDHSLEINRLKVPETAASLRPESAELKTGVLLNTASWDYCWNVQHHSVREFPNYWSHPVDLLLEFTKSSNYRAALLKAIRQSREVIVNMSSGTNEHSSTLPAFVNTSLPTTIGLKCPAPYLHQLKQESSDEGIYSAKVKAFYMKETIYRLFRKSKMGLEIYPEDGSIIIATGLTDQIFTHLTFTDGKVEERLYSKLYPPPISVDLPYSIPKIISTAARLLEVLSHEEVLMETQGEPVCYECTKSSETPEIPSLPVVIEECIIPDVGRFTAHSNGILHVVFTDRTCLNMMIELSTHLFPQSRDNVAFRPRSRLSPEWPAGYCRLLLPNGHYHFANISYPEVPYKKYVKCALDWAAWVNTPATERSAFYGEQSAECQRINAVDLELRKIQCFSHILENSFLPKTKIVLKNDDFFLDDKESDSTFNQSNSSAEGTVLKFDDKSVDDVLRRNSEMLKDITDFLKQNVELKS